MTCLGTLWDHGAVEALPPNILHDQHSDYINILMSRSAHLSEVQRRGITAQTGAVLHGLYHYWPLNDWLRSRTHAGQVSSAQFLTLRANHNFSVRS